jgi:hypothetical protein
MDDSFVKNVTNPIFILSDVLGTPAVITEIILELFISGFEISFTRALQVPSLVAVPFNVGNLKTASLISFFPP